MKYQKFTSNRIVRLLKATLDDWLEDNAQRLSAALAYYSIFSIAPLLVIAISVAGLVLGEDAVRGQLAAQLNAYVGPQAAKGIQSMVLSASKPSEGWIGTIVGFATLLLGAAGVFGQLQDALNTIWEVKRTSSGGWKAFVRARLLNFGIVLAIGFLLLTSLLLTTALAAMNGYVERVIGIPPFISGLLAFCVSFCVVTTLFAFIFKVLPDARIKWRHVWNGAIVTALLFELGKFGLSFYLGRESTASSFGAAGSVVVILLWVFYASCIVLFGAEFTQVYAREFGETILPSENAVAVTAEGRAQQGLVPAAEIEAEPPNASKRVIEVRPPIKEPAPISALLAITTVSFVVGLIARCKTRKQ